MLPLRTRRTQATRPQVIPRRTPRRIRATRHRTLRRTRLPMAQTTVAAAATGGSL
jgi:hypothetical protein